MESGFPYGDIIVIGAIAAFIILRYRAMLGEKSGRDSDLPTMKSAPLEEYERVIQLPDRERARVEEVAPKPKDKDYGSLNDTFSAMRAIDRTFSADEFIEGARGAYEMVIEAYNKHDEETMKMLLSADLYKSFKATIDENEEKGRKPETTLIAILKAAPTEAKLTGNKARVTVHFQSEQVILVRDADGKIIEGNAGHQDAVEDTWVFERSLTNQDPNWKIIET